MQMYLFMFKRDARYHNLNAVMSHGAYYAHFETVEQAKNELKFRAMIEQWKRGVLYKTYIDPLMPDREEFIAQFTPPQ